MALVDEVKSRSDIIQVISEYVDLDTSSRQPKALCPFHAERTPSFVIYPDTASWRCFGSCSEGGDVISFVMKRENMSFAQALENLADRAGIKREVFEKNVSKKPVTKILDANDIAADYFFSRLKAPIGETVREYLFDRGIDIETAARRGLGFAPSGMETLSGHLRTRSVQGRAARDAGLIARKSDGEWRDMFIGRLTIEIRDSRDRIVGFGARTLDGSEPKYLNTPQTDVFDKSSILYGLNWADESIRSMNEAIVVEGYMDVIAAHEHGFTNVVASMGTAVTQNHLGTLARYAAAGGKVGTIVLCLDSDAAGESATMRALESVTEELIAGVIRGVQVKVARSVGGKDPDQAIRANPDQWRGSLSEAEPLLDYLIIAKSKLYDLASGQGKAQFANSVAPVVYSITNGYDQEHYWSMIARLVDVTPERLKTIVDKPAVRTNIRRPSGSSTKPGLISSSQVNAALEQGDSLEEHMLSLVMQIDDLREYAVEMPDEYFHQSDNRALFTAWQGSSKLRENIDELGDDLTEKAQQLRNRKLPPSNQARHVDDITQCVKRLKERHFRLIKKLEADRFKEIEGQERQDLLDQAILPNENLRTVMTGRR
ncbi:MAG: DNA primase [Chloroflexi bacterium]|nr:DNA primase [Chloroflexota bacterium]MQF81783.1 DNA primase [SAR202 cluster bacterium]